MTKKNKKNWVDYKEIKERVSIEMVLERYGVELKKKGKNLVGCCPIHKGSNPSQFSVSTEKNIFNCFGNCKTGGNVIDFVALMEFGNKENQSVREAALLIKNWFSPGSKNEPGGNKQVRKKKEDQKQTDNAPKVNKPLSFTLTSLDPEHAFFEERGILQATVKHFGLGYCSKGMMKDRIAIPIHDHKGHLVAYCGRGLTPEQIEDEKYKQPPGFYKSEVVYNLCNLDKKQGPVIIVESFISVWLLFQAGYKNVCALMGSFLSKSQKKLIAGLLGPQGRVLLMFDADEDGEKCTNACIEEFSPELYVKTVDISAYAKKPHQLTPEQINELV